ncbi:hypothetical protein MyNCGM152_25410 [Achromobacter xylosoxidans]
MSCVTALATRTGTAILAIAAAMLGRPPAPGRPPLALPGAVAGRSAHQAMPAATSKSTASPMILRRVQREGDETGRLSDMGNGSGTDGESRIVT